MGLRFMVTPQQRKQVIVKSIGEIEREATIRARPMGSRVNNTAKAAAFGNTVGEGIGGIKDMATTSWESLQTGAGWYGTFTNTKANWLLIGLAYGNPTARRYAVPNKEWSIVANAPNCLFTAHVLTSAVLGFLGRGK